MTVVLADALVEAAHELGLDMEVYEGYSGRAMFGEKTQAVTFKGWPEFCQAVARLAVILTEEEEVLPGMLDATEMVDQLGKLRFDQLGLGMIAY